MRWLEEVLRGAHDQLEEDFRGWITDLTAANTALGHELGSRMNRRLSGARERLEGLERALRQAPGHIVDHLRPRNAELVLTTVITYGISIPRLGYYHDDWFLLWSGQARGAASIIPLFSTDRPFMGVVYSIVYRMLGDTIANWHLYALLWRFIGGLAFFWILRILWPRERYITTLMAVLFVVYPGFLSQPNANTKQNHLFGFGTALLSIALTLQAMKTSRRGWRLVCTLVSLLLSANYLWIYEYMLGFEGARLLLIGYGLTT